MSLIFSRWHLILFQWENTGHLAGNPSTSSSITCRLTIPTSASILISLPPVVTVSLLFKLNLVLSLILNSITLLDSFEIPLHKESHFLCLYFLPLLLVLSLLLINIFNCPKQRTTKAFHNPVSSSTHSSIASLALEILHILPLPSLFSFTPKATNLASVSTESALVKISEDLHMV